jgi:hypothetical protein
MFPNRLLLISLALLLSGCGSTGWFAKREKPVEIITTSVQRTPLALPDPAPLRLTSPRWRVVTPQNIDSTWKELEERKTDLVLFALTDDGYEDLSISMAEIRNFIATQRAIILKYREYYENSAPKSTPPK